jgi:predicted metal-dependent phosphoesterase TrpH
MHTARSDGRWPAGDVLARCARGGLDVIAITDHDLPPPFAVGRHVVDDKVIHVLGGAEVSGMHEGREFHLLVYFPGEIPTAFRTFCAEQCARRAERYAEATARLPFRDLPPPSDAARRGEVALTRLHLAQELVAAKHVVDVREAFAKFLGERHGHVPPIALSFVDAIHIARSFGALTSWAHPSRKDAETFTATFAAAGLQGLEVLRPGLSSEERRALRKIAARHGLFLTGGSDWHGWGDDGNLGLFQVLGREIESFVGALAAA